METVRCAWALLKVGVAEVKGKMKSVEMEERSMMMPSVMLKV